MKKVIIESNLTSHQRFMLVLFFIAFFIIGLLEVIGIFLFYPIELDSQDFGILFLFFVSFVILLFLLSKEGIIIDNNKLFNSQFIFGKPYLKREIDTNGMTDISVLNYDMSQKLAFVSSVNPDFSEKIRNRKIFLLNEKHSQKRVVISTKKIENVEVILKEIQDEFSVKYNHYHPPTRRRRRR